MRDFILGTAQLGMKYGIVNRTGQPAGKEALAIVHHALFQGVNGIDTARDYGVSENIIGDALAGSRSKQATVITKLDPLRNLPDGAREDFIRAAVDASVQQSCEALRTNRLDVLMLHRWEHHRKWDGAIWRKLLSLRDEGKIRSLGASIYQPTEALEALRDSDIRYLQVPMNILDWRWRAADVNKAITSRRDVLVHARSALLQGILIHGADLWPQVDGFDSIRCVNVIESLTVKLRRESPADLCLAYVRSQPWIHGVVVGCETLTQLKENLRLFSRSTLDFAECNDIERGLPVVPVNLLNPAKWKRHSTVGAI